MVAAIDRIGTYDANQLGDSQNPSGRLVCPPSCGSRNIARIKPSRAIGGKKTVVFGHAGSHQRKITTTRRASVSTKNSKPGSVIAIS